MENKLEDVNKFYDVMVEFFANYSLQIIGALILIALGVVVSKYVQKLLLGLLLKNGVDETLSKFATNFLRFLIIAMTSILALQGSVSNFAAGIVLVITKPFKIGDTLSVRKIYGEVQDIKLSYTVLVNEDGEQITIPNKYMIGDVLVNSFDYRIVEGSVGVSYDSGVDIGYRYWAPTKLFFKTRYEVNLKVFVALNAAKVEIPFPQREVRIIGDENVSK
jgi:small conductance mechanosensitive channel